MLLFLPSITLIDGTIWFSVQVSLIFYVAYVCARTYCYLAADRAYDCASLLNAVADGQLRTHSTEFVLHALRSCHKGRHMFFHLQLDKDIEVEPRFFGPRLQEILKQKVTSEVRLSSDAATARPACVLRDTVVA